MTAELIAANFILQILTVVFVVTVAFAISRIKYHKSTKEQS